MSRESVRIEVVGGRAYVPARVGRLLETVLSYETLDFAPDPSGLLRAVRRRSSIAVRDGGRLSFPAALAHVAAHCLDRLGYRPSVVGRRRRPRGRVRIDPA